MPPPKTLNFITGNANKLAEVRAILAAVPGVELRSQNLDLPELQGTIEEIGRDKCGRAADMVRFFSDRLRRGDLCAMDVGCGCGVCGLMM